MSIIQIISTAFDPRPEWRERCTMSVQNQKVPKGVTVSQRYINAAVDVVPKGHLEHVFNIVHRCSPETIIVELDGDDWFADEFALETVLREYERGAWMTYGQFVIWDGKRVTSDKGWASEYSKEAHETAAYRLDTWRATHLKTYRAGLFQEIPMAYLLDIHPRASEDWIDWVGTDKRSMRWFTRATDQATMFPMLEMARERAHFIPEEIYVYNTTNPLSSHNCPEIVEDEKRQTLAVRSLRPLPRRGTHPW